jgi:LPXTG-site transpeptidase (sortase) family protein
MALYAYIKQCPEKKTFKNKNNYFLINSIKILPYFSIIIGLVLLLIVVFPFISYRLMMFSRSNKEIIIPITETVILESKGFISPLNSKVLSAEDTKKSPEITEEVDLNQINNWFPNATLSRIKPSKITHYTLSISELNIYSAVVAVGQTEVKKSLVHYPGTALPGDYGNTVIFGHSVLPIFYNPKNYETIFSTLPTLELGSEINIYFDGVEYLYIVEDYYEVGPDEVSVLEQRFNEQILSLITCVPPGTYQKRGIIKARLKN